MGLLFWILAAVVCFMVQLFYWYLVFNKLVVKMPQTGVFSFYPVSLVICAHSAVQHLKKNLHSFLDQDYPTFEVILVDDGSTDETAEWMQEQISRDPKLRYYRIEKTGPGKKAALAFGISKAKHDWIAVSDADCKPLSTSWLQSMMQNIGEKTDIIIAYGPYDKLDGWLNKLIRFETLLNAIQYLNAACKGFPYMGVGRNMVYRKSLFDQSALNPSIISGDDDLLIAAKATKYNTAVCIARDSFVSSAPAQSYAEYFQQKRRHYSTANYYRKSIRFFLLAFFISLSGFFMSLLTLFFSGQFVFALVLYICYSVLIMPVFCRNANQLNEKDLCKFYPFLIVMYWIHLCLQFPFLWVKKKKW